MAETAAAFTGNGACNRGMEMPPNNSYIGQVFDELADLLEIEGANPFRVRAYRNAAREVPRGLIQLLKIPMLGPKRVSVLSPKTGNGRRHRSFDHRESTIIYRLPFIEPADKDVRVTSLP